jgi:polyisoprenoid-binding protein YceI
MTTTAAISQPPPLTTGAQDHIRRLDPDDVVVAVTTRHLFGLGRVTASVRLASGLVWLDGAGELVGVEAELDVRSFASGSRARDRAVASPRLLDAAQHPSLAFRSTGTSTAADGRRLVEGTLTVKGVSASTVLVVQPPAAADDHVRATARIDRYAHGITAGRGLAGRHLDVEITVAVPPASEV